MQQKRVKAHSGLGHYNDQTLIGGSAEPMNQDKTKMSKIRVRSQLGKHQSMPLEQINYNGLNPVDIGPYRSFVNIIYSGRQ